MNNFAALLQGFSVAALPINLLAALAGGIMGIVVGILLHVAVNILFDHDHNNFTVAKLLLIILAFVAAYFTPGCPEIYPMF